MIDDLQTRGIPIDGVGLQMHITYNTPPLNNIVAVMDAIVQRGLLIHISEMDVRVNPKVICLNSQLYGVNFRSNA